MKRGFAIPIAYSTLLFATCAYAQTSKQVDAAKSKKNGHVAFWTTSGNEIVGLRTTLRVPAKPEPAGTIFLWPGLQPDRDGRNYFPIGNGVLQPVLTWGPSCAPGEKPRTYSTWWISGQYVNTQGSCLSPLIRPERRKACGIKGKAPEHLGLIPPTYILDPSPLSRLPPE
jgi:hypothetical protein